jgi:hypothetical protein
VPASPALATQSQKRAQRIRPARNHHGSAQPGRISRRTA